MFYGPEKCFNKLGKLGKRLAFSSPTMVLLEPKKILNANFKPRFSFNRQLCTIFDEFGGYKFTMIIFWVARVAFYFPLISLLKLIEMQYCVHFYILNTPGNRRQMG